ncbi:hypothetical protein CANCADRAFT_31267 [Tortispora caseinolytica NRRL Y-17796]|uniref:PH domain-containing protein n=1 Tax=Tortispora caseinolytica NRRL Y-17796 TaxID=767744 RepID=A0A1E4TEP9_9ASCO|nr:hypothetical protein CANCADRAFT_31267 [Tortispora caseinolytica NRRL Y-17796]
MVADTLPDLPLKIAFHDFTRRTEDELTIQKGDQIKVLKTDEGFNDGWYLGFNLRTRETGVFPCVYTSDVQPTPTITAHNDAVSYFDDGSAQKRDSLSARSTSSHASPTVDRALSDIDKAISDLQTTSDPADTFVNETSPLASSSNIQSESVHTWTPEQVSEHFAQVGFEPDVSQAMIKHKISGNILLELDLGHLKELEISTFGTRFEINKEIIRLRNVEQAHSQQQRASLSPSKPLSPASPTTITSNISAHQSSTPTLMAPPQPPAHLRKTLSTIRRTAAIDSRGGIIGGNSAVSENNRLMPTYHENSNHRRFDSAVSQITEDSEYSVYNGTRDEEAKLEHTSETSMSTEHTESAPNTPTLESLRRKSGGGNSYVGNGNMISKPANSNGLNQGDVTPTGSPYEHASAEGSVSPGQTQVHSFISDAQVLAKLPNRPHLKKSNSKKNTSAFLEGLQSVTPEVAASTADQSGWLYKRAGKLGGWNKRFFTLHGTRLSYFVTMEDTREKGLIDVNSHKVSVLDTDDALIALHAAGLGHGRHCFKLTPPGPGGRKGVTFTAPKTHYFAAESREAMKKWTDAFLKATIDKDDSVPVISTCVTPTISLAKAQEIFGSSEPVGNVDSDTRETYHENGFA